MFLSSVQIENYRAIRKAKVTFNSTTVVIGENECGKSSIFEAIQIVLNPQFKESIPVFQSFQFHFSDGNKMPADPIQIILAFEERFRGEWSETEYEPVAFLFSGGRKSKRKLRFKLSSVYSKSNEGGTTWTIGSPGTNLHSSDPKLLYWLRLMNPAIWLSAGMLTGHGSTISMFPEKIHSVSYSTPEVHDYTKQIQECASRILSDKSTNLTTDIEKGFNASLKLIDQVRKKNDSGSIGLGRKISEILGKENHFEGGSLAPILSQSGSMAQRLGVLLLVASLLRVMPEELIDEMEPIWIIENPEANLHPITLASVAILINGIKWQKIVTTYSSVLFNAVPLSQVRRLTRFKGIVSEHKVNEKIFSREDLRRIGYHLQVQHSIASFSRMWLLVEGESEFWILPQLARLMNYDFSMEGISCMDFAQSGLTPIIKLAMELGIEWHLLADGDAAGRSYLTAARRLINPYDYDTRLTKLMEDDIEHFFYKSGYAEVYRKHARISSRDARNMKPGRVIHRAVKNYSKPYLALSIVKAVDHPDSPGIPVELKNLIEYCIKLAREAPARSSIDE
jgi:putative ATP-dependent endonuclease of OLD family